MNKGISITVFRGDLADTTTPLGEISLESITTGTSFDAAGPWGGKPEPCGIFDIVRADFVIFVDQSNGDTKVLKNRYGNKGVVVPVQ